MGLSSKHASGPAESRRGTIPAPAGSSREMTISGPDWRLS